MNVRLGLRRLAGGWRQDERYDIEQELYEDLRDTEGMIDLAEYDDLVARHREAVNYIDLSPALLDAEHKTSEAWPAA